MSHHEKICRVLGPGKRRELGKHIDCVESIYHMLVLRAYERVILIQLHCIRTHVFQPLHKILPHFSSFLRMSHGMMFL